MKTLSLTTATAALILGAIAAPALANHHGDMAKHEKMMKKKSDVSFATIDVNSDMRVDFTEFANHFENEHGWSAADSAVEFTRLADDSGTISAEAMKNIRMERSEMKTVSSSPTQTVTTETMTTQTTVNTSNETMAEPVSRSSFSQPMSTTMTQPTTTTTVRTSMVNFGGMGFADLDANSDGMVSYSEYAKVRAKSDVSATKAAREFISITNGQRSFDQNRYNNIVSMGGIGETVFTSETGLNTVLTTNR